MTLEQCENRNRAIMENALAWAKGEDCLPLESLDVAIIAEYLKMDLPKCFYNFVESENPNHIKAYGAHKTIMKTLDKMREKLLKGRCKNVGN